MLNFGNKVEERSNDLIPKDTLLWMRITVRGMKNSKETNGRFADLELTIAENQPYAGRKVWDTIMDAFDATNSQAARDLGTSKVRRILEGVFGARPDNQNSYALPNYEALGGQHLVPVRIDIQKAKAGSGYEDKNVVDYLSPHSSVKKVVECYNLLRSGVNKYEKAGGAPAPAAGAHPGFGMQPQPQPSGFTPPAQAPAAPAGGNAPGWLAPAQTPPAAAPAPQAPPAGFQTPPAQPTAMAAAGGFQPAPASAAPVQEMNNPPGFQSPQQAGFAPAAGNTPQTPPMQADTVNAAPSPSSAPAQGWAPPQGAMPAQLPGQGNGQQ
jgi:hypothetical protein